MSDKRKTGALRLSDFCGASIFRLRDPLNTYSATPSGSPPDRPLAELIKQLIASTGWKPGTCLAAPPLLVRIGNMADPASGGGS